MRRSNGGIIGPDNVTTGGFSGVASGVFKLGEVTDLIRESKWPEVSPFINTIPNSVRLDGGGTYFSRTQTAGNRRTWTQSGWYKFDGIDPGNAQSLVSTNGTNTGTNFHYTLEKGGSSGGASDTLSCHGYSGDIFQTTRLLRDYSGWYHIVLAVDTTQGTSANRMKLYVNGESVTMSEQAQYPAQNFEFGVNNNNIVIGLGTHPGSVSGYQFSGYMANIELVDGLAYGPEYFGSTNADSGIWTPVPTSTISSYGTNGFKLAFANASALGTDTSGQSNNFTANSITSIDQGSDSPSNNFATANPIGSQRIGGGSIRPTVYSEANLTILLGSGGYYTRATSTIAVSTGRWYWETKMISNCDSGSDPTIGIIGTGGNQNEQTGTSPNSSMQYRYTGQKGYNNVGNASYGATWTNGDIIGIALDLTSATKTITFYKNNVSQGVAFSGNGTSDGFDPANEYWSPFWVAGGSTNATMSLNMGNPPYALSSAVADGNGFGQFEYAPPTGYFSLCTNNLNVI